MEPGAFVYLRFAHFRLLLGLLRGIVRNRDSECHKLERDAYLARQAAERDRKADARVEQVVERLVPGQKDAFDPMHAAGRN